MKFENTNVYNMMEAIRAMRLSYNSESDSFVDGSGEAYIAFHDFELIKKLVAAGPSHRKFMRQILLSVDITAPRYWWTQFDTYKVGVTACSESTMHTLMKRPLTFEDVGIEEEDMHRDDQLGVIKYVNDAIVTGNFRRAIKLLPQGYRQKRHVTMNYEVVRTIREQRKGHKLDEWREFIEWADKLPHANIFFGGNDGGDV